MDFVAGHLCWGYKRRSCFVSGACTFIHCCWRRYLSSYSQFLIPPLALVLFYYFCMIDTDILFSMLIIIDFVLAEHRHVGSNNFNLFSSRSHTIFTLVIFLSLIIVGVWSCKMILPKHVWHDCLLNFMNLDLVFCFISGSLVLSLVTMSRFTLFWSRLL